MYNAVLELKSIQSERLESEIWWTMLLILTDGCEDGSRVVIEPETHSGIAHLRGGRGSTCAPISLRAPQKS